MKAKIFYGICVAILLWLAVSTIEVWVHNAKEIKQPYNKANAWAIVAANAHITKTMTVTDCQGIYSDDYEVTVEDSNGNLWAYIDTEPKEIGITLTITMDGDEIIDAR